MHLLSILIYTLCYGLCLCAMQMDSIEELEKREHQKGEQLKATKQSLKEKEKEYFALEVGD